MVTVVQDLNINTANNLLQQYKGSDALVAMYSPSLRRFVISLHKGKDALYLALVGCEHMNGPFSWRNADISISVVPTEFIGNVTRVSDKITGFELMANGGFVLFHGPANEFGDTFDNFIDWDKANIGPNPGSDTV